MLGLLSYKPKNETTFGVSDLTNSWLRVKRHTREKGRAGQQVVLVVVLVLPRLSLPLSDQEQ